MAIATATALALAASLGGAGLSAYNANKTAGRQDREAAAGIRRQSANQQEATARINQTVQQVRDSNPDDERKTAQAQYLAQLMRQMGQAKAGLAGRGISKEFDDLAATAGDQVSADAGDTAGLFARMDAPILQRTGEAFQQGNLGMDLSRIGGNVRGDDFLNKLRFQGIRRNPWMDLAAGALQGLGRAGLSGGLGGGSAGGAGFGVPLPGSGPYVGSGYGSIWGTGAGLGH